MTRERSLYDALLERIEDNIDEGHPHALASLTCALESLARTIHYTESAPSSHEHPGAASPEGSSPTVEESPGVNPVDSPEAEASGEPSGESLDEWCVEVDCALSSYNERYTAELDARRFVETACSREATKEVRLYFNDELVDRFEPCLTESLPPHTEPSHSHEALTQGIGEGGGEPVVHEAGFGLVQVIPPAKDEITGEPRTSPTCRPLPPNTPIKGTENGSPGWQAHHDAKKAEAEG